MHLQPEAPLLQVDPVSAVVPLQRVAPAQLQSAQVQASAVLLPLVAQVQLQLVQVQASVVLLPLVAQVPLQSEVQLVLEVRTVRAESIVVVAR